ncbi:MAG: lipopolysaccharide heptosyltransferase II [Deltaproteobacteria bacterium]|nr:lipopolysaccharide heptosyltransferase II [Deltaproteobacteria bacterium]
MAGLDVPQLKPDEIRRILIRATNWIGDAVMTLPALEAVGETFPLSAITVLTKPWVAPIYESHPAVRSVMIFDKSGGSLNAVGSIIKASGRVRRGQFDLAILFQNAFEAALIAFLGGIRRRAGYTTDARGLLLTHGISPHTAQKNQHQVEYYLDLMRGLGWKERTRDPYIYVPESWRFEVSGLMASSGIEDDRFLLGLAPGAAFGKAKRWPAKRFAEIGDRAAEEWDARVLIFGSEGEQHICHEVMDDMTHRPFNLCGRTSLSQAIAWIDRCKFFLSNDSGLMHVASALNVPTVAVFGSTDPVATGPRGAKTAIVRHPVSCAPCLKPQCDRDYRCLYGVTVERVWEEMKRLWRTSR